MERKIFIVHYERNIKVRNFFSFWEVALNLLRASCWIRHGIHLTSLKTFHFWGSSRGEFGREALESDLQRESSTFYGYQEVQRNFALRAGQTHIELKLGGKEKLFPHQTNAAWKFCLSASPSVSPRNRKCKSSEISSRISFLKVTLLLLAPFLYFSMGKMYSTPREWPSRCVSLCSLTLFLSCFVFAASSRRGCR